MGAGPGREAEGASGPGRKPQAMTSSPRPPAAAHGVFNHSDGRTSPGCARPRGSDMPHLPCAFQSLVFVWDSGEKKNDQRAVILETNTSPHLARAGSPVAKSGVWALAGEGGRGGTRGAPTPGPPPGARTQKLGCRGHTHSFLQTRGPRQEPVCNPKRGLSLPRGAGMRLGPRP